MGEMSIDEILRGILTVSAVCGSVLCGRMVVYATRALGFDRGRTMNMLGIVILLTGIGLSAFMRWANLHYAELDLMRQEIMDWMWLVQVGLSLMIVGVFWCIRTVTLDECGERGWMILVALSVAIPVIWDNFA